MCVLLKTSSVLRITVEYLVANSDCTSDHHDHHYYLEIRKLNSLANEMLKYDGSMISLSNWQVDILHDYL